MATEEKFKDRNLMEELSWGTYGIKGGYLRESHAEFLRWLCGAAYDEIKRLKEELENGKDKD